MKLGTNSVLTRPIAGPSAWTRKDIDLDRVIIPVGQDCRDELLRFIEHLRTHPLPQILLQPDDYGLVACEELAARVRAALTDGLRFCIVDRLPVDRMSHDDATTCYWVLASMIRRPVAQKLDGTMIYDVVDTGQAANAGSGVRPDKTSIELTFHNDNAYNRCMPEVVGLLCLNAARAGGVSRVISFDAVYNALLVRAPDVLPRLYQPFWFDRQKEHRAEEEPVFAAPIFESAGTTVMARLGLHQLRNAYVLRGEDLDEPGQRAIRALEDVFEEPGLQFHFEMEPGQIQFVDNRAIGHSRTRFEDYEEPERRRRLVRLWLRDAGDRSYPG